MASPYVAVAALAGLAAMYIGWTAAPPLEPAVARSLDRGFGHCASASEPTCVVDGDTLRYRGVKIRLADINTPEIFSPECAAEERLGLRARDRLIELINAGPVEMVRGGARDEDAYGRKLRVLERNGHSLGMILVEEGLAHRWRGYKESWCS